MRYFYHLLTSFLLMASANLWAQGASFQASPLSVKLNDDGVNPKPFKINVGTTKSVTLRAKVVNIHQNANGELSPIDFSPDAIELKAIKLLESEKKLDKGGSWIVEGNADLRDRSFRKSRLIGVSIEEVPKAKKSEGQSGNFASVYVRYLILLRINFDNIDVRATGKTTFNGLESDFGKLVAKASFSNTGKAMASIVTELNVRNSDKKIVEERILKTSSMRRADKNTKQNVLPGSKVELSGVLENIKQPGEYHLTLKTYINGRAPSVSSQSIKITPEMINNNKMSISPQKIELEYIKGKIVLNEITFKNPSSEPVIVTLEGRGKVPENGGEFGWVPTRVEIPAHSKGNSQFRALNNYGPIEIPGVVAVFRKTSGEVIEKIAIPASFVTKK